MILLKHIYNSATVSVTTVTGSRVGRINFELSVYVNRLSGVIGSVFASSVVDQIKPDYTNVICCCFPARKIEIRSKSKVNRRKA